MTTPLMVPAPAPEQLVEIARWRHTEPTPDRWSTATPPAPLDHAATVRELTLRVATLQSAKRRVIVAVDSNFITLSSSYPAPPPPPPPPPAPLPATETVGGVVVHHTVKQGSGKRRGRPGVRA